MPRMCVWKRGALPLQRCILQDLRKAVKPLEQGSISSREASRYYGIPTRTRNSRWKSDNMAQKMLGPLGAFSNTLCTAFIIFSTWPLLWHVWLVAGFSPQRTGYNSRPVCVVDKVPLGRVSLRILRFCPFSTVSQMIRILSFKLLIYLTLS
jgi:hypothetical protein